MEKKKHKTKQTIKLITKMTWLCGNTNLVSIMLLFLHYSSKNKLVKRRDRSNAVNYFVWFCMDSLSMSV